MCMIQFCASANLNSLTCQLHRCSIIQILHIVDVEMTDLFILCFVYIPVTVPPAFNTTGMTITVNETDDAILSCTADGIPRPTIIWFRGSVRSRGEEQVEDHKAFREDLAAGQNGITSTLNISDTIPDDTAMYTCQASNAVDDVVLSPGFMLVVIEGRR